MAKIDLTAARLRELLSYDPDTGVFTRLVKRTTGGSGWADKQGYLQLCVGGKTYSAHRLAWLYMTGSWPVADIDHINGVKHDNRFANLRDVPELINMQNIRSPNKNNACGLMGVHWRKDRQCWVAQVRINGKAKRCGAFKTPEEAHEAYLAIKRQHHPGFLL